MKKAFTLALLGVLAVSPALARGAGEQRSDIQGSRSSSSSASSSSVRLDQNTARQIQQQLQQQGYDVGPVDGVWGTKSRQALMKFQRDQSLRASGRPDQQTMAALGLEQSTTQQAQTPEGDRSRSQDQQQQYEQSERGRGIMGR